MTFLFSFLAPASRHDSHSFLYNWLSMKQILPDTNVTKLILDSAHDTMPYYEYCKTNGITPYIDLKRACVKPPFYKDDITINEHGIPLCPKGFPMKQAAVEPKRDVSNTAVLKLPSKATFLNTPMKNYALMQNT